MMRKVFSVALMATMAFVFAQSANAGVTSRLRSAGSIRPVTGPDWNPVT